ncbi:MAG: transcription termination/antitermination protein NusA [Chlamydiae bacterium]|nr:transcription termination/antitermination protein NusA [Chlamydiota bacterium]MBI3277904.1 transcription termination/antitermination protein NusA [Chlamydiota bacterium]
MNGELLNVLDFLEREKGIKREILIKAVESSLLSASRKGLGAQKNTVVIVDPKTGDIKAVNKMLVVEKVVNSKEELSLEQAKQYKNNPKIGDEIDIEITPKNFGRIAAQIAKQVIIQKIREAEKDILFNEYKERTGDLVTGIVRRYERRNVVVDLGKCEAILPVREQCPTEKYPIGSRVRAYVMEVKDNPKTLEVILSRTHAGLLKNLFELEIPEISDGIVEIKAVAREAGFRSKVAVHSSSEKIDPVGACVGMRGERIKNIVRELNGEKIDIVLWNPDHAVFVGNAISPAKLKKVYVSEPGKKVEILVEPDQLSLAIGRKGQNARLCAKLTGYHIDILADRVTPIEGAPKEKPEVVFSAGERAEEAPSGLSLSEVQGLEEGILKSLRQTGYRTVEEVLRLPPVELSKVVGLDEAQAIRVLEWAKKLLEDRNTKVIK